MRPEGVIEHVVNAGGKLTVCGDRIRYRLPKDHPEKERILAELREHKPDIIRLLSVRQTTCAATCHEVEPGRWVHHPWDGCTTSELAEPRPKRQVDVPCWHCDGAGHCGCIACWRIRPGQPARCVVCKGSGKALAWVQ